MDTATNPLVVTAAVVLGGRVEPSQLERVIRERLLRHDRFCAKAIKRGGRYRWVREDPIRLEDHLKFHRRAHELSHEELRVEVEQLVNQKLDANKPLWRIDLIEDQRRSVLLFAAHHCIADGVALIRVLLSLADDATQDRLSATSASRASAGTGSFTRVLRILWGTLRLLFCWFEKRAVVKGRPDGYKRLDWIGPVPFQKVRAAAKSLGVTINDLFLFVLTRAFRDFLARSGEDPVRRNLGVMVPVSVRELTDPIELGNMFGLTVLQLPVGLQADADILAALRGRIARFKRYHEGYAGYLFLKFLGLLPKAFEKLLVTIFGMKIAGVFSNVPGPRQAIRLAGQDVRDIVAWAPVGDSVGTALTVFSYDDRMYFALSTDRAVIERPTMLRDCMETQLRAVIGADGSGETAGRTSAAEADGSR